ncbi:unnamed protein product [Cylindrotheca closterium]|uniref:Uncharacterized protein n=1 Tax=Cylindrotheca closterium TaxID=2856 RepID=A0AAD2FCE7_9STRA|nr:unnamed protein product [Cylindrotheca closterium]
MSNEYKRITIAQDGGVYDISNEKQFHRLLEWLDAKFLENSESKRRVTGYAALVDGGTYTVTSRNVTNTASSNAAVHPHKTTVEAQQPTMNHRSQAEAPGESNQEQE